jgi:chromosome segregation ATPase
MADNNSEILALLAESLRAADRDRAENMHRFAQLTETMVNGFLRLEDKLSARIDGVAASVDHLTSRVDNLTGRVDNLTSRVEHLTSRVDHLTSRVDHLTEEVAELKTDMREVKADIREIKVQGQEANRRLGNTFDHVGQFTEQTEASQLRLSQVEEAQQPTNAELDARLRAVEEQLRRAS